MLRLINGGMRRTLEWGAAGASRRRSPRAPPALRGGDGLVPAPGPHVVLRRREQALVVRTEDHAVPPGPSVAARRGPRGRPGTVNRMAPPAKQVNPARGHPHSVRRAFERLIRGMNLSELESTDQDDLVTTGRARYAAGRAARRTGRARRGRRYGSDQRRGHADGTGLLWALRGALPHGDHRAGRPRAVRRGRTRRIPSAAPSAPRGAPRRSSTITPTA